MIVHYMGERNFLLFAEHGFDQQLLDDFISDLERPDTELSLKNHAYTDSHVCSVLFGPVTRPRVFRFTDRIGYALLKLRRYF